MRTRGLVRSPSKPRSLCAACHERSYTKPALSAPDLLRHLEARGLSVPDPLAALHVLEYVGYYRLLIYMRPLQAHDPATGVQRFVPGTTFDDVMELYEFDRELRLLTLDAIERIEVALRSAIVGQVAVQHGPHFFLEPQHFARLSAFVEFYQAVGRENKHAGVRHYHANYEAPDMPPLWAMMEAITYGTLSRLFAGLQLSHRKAIAVRFGFDEVVLASWFRALNLLRNMCAHHNRLWNMSLHVDQPVAAKRLKSELGGVGDRYYARAVVMAALLEMIDPDSDWKERLVALLDGHPRIPTAAMGFPPDWRARPFWRASADGARAAA